MTTKKSAEKKLVSIKKSPKSLGKPMKGRDILVKALVNEGVMVIFGYPGGASMEIHQGLTLAPKIRMVLPGELVHVPARKVLAELRFLEGAKGFLLFCCFFASFL